MTGKDPLNDALTATGKLLAYYAGVAAWLLTTYLTTR